MGYTGKIPAKVPLTSDDIVDGSITNADIADLDAAKLTGTVAEARLATLAATKLTGNIADARIPASAVTQHVTAADLTPAHQGIANLGLIMATEHNKVAFNLTGSFIDIFQDDSGIATETTVDRNASEYVSAVTTGVGSQTLISGSTGTIIGTQTSSGLWDGSNTAGQTSGQGGDNWSGKDWGVGVTKTINGYGIWNNENTYGIGVHDTTVNVKLQGSTDGFSSSIVDLGETGAVADGQGQAYPFNISKLTGITTSTAYRYHRILIPSSTNVDVRWSELELYDNPSTLVTSATGTLISNAQTVASTSEVSGVFTYTDSAGTNTIGTDLKIYFTANNGANWTEAASYGTATTFSGSIKQVKLGKTTVTAGTQVALKAVWANQVATVAGGTSPIDSSEFLSGSNHTLTAVADATTSTTIKKFGTQSMQFDGTGDWYTVPDGSWADLGTGDFTMEAWVYYTSGSGFKAIIGSGNWGGPDYNWSWDMNASNRYPRFSMYNGSSEALVTMATAITASTWTHLAVCRSGGTITQYLNGTANGTTIASTQNVASAGVVYIGNQSRGVPWQGNLQEVRMSNNARYTGNFTSFGQDGGTISSPTPFTTDSNTLLLVHGSGTAEVTGKIAHLNGWAVNY